jgi:hypothetical protein
MPRRRLLILVSLFPALWLLPKVQATSAERKVEENIVVSDHDPPVQIQLPRSVHHVGNDHWVLYGIADCDLYAFVEANERKVVERLYWIQFEAYLPSRPDLHHTYDSPHHLTMADWDFYVDTWVRARDAPIDGGSDREHIEEMIRKQGYTMPAGMMYVRLVHLLDGEKRKELMIIYGENLAPTGRSANELAKEGKAHDEWGRIQEDLVKRAEDRIKLHPTEKQ